MGVDQSSQQAAQISEKLQGTAGVAAGFNANRDVLLTIAEYDLYALRRTNQEQNKVNVVDAIIVGGGPAG